MNSFIIIKALTDEICCGTVINHFIIFQSDINCLFKDELSIKIHYNNAKCFASQLLKCYEIEKNRKEAIQTGISCEIQSFRSAINSKCDFGFINGHFFIENTDSQFALHFGFNDRILFDLTRIVSQIWPTIIYDYEKYLTFFEQISALEEKHFLQLKSTQLNVNFFFLSAHKNFIFYWLVLKNLCQEDEPQLKQ